MSLIIGQPVQMHLKTSFSHLTLKEQTKNKKNTECRIIFSLTGPFTFPFIFPFHHLGLLPLRAICGAPPVFFRHHICEMGKDQTWARWRLNDHSVRELFTQCTRVLRLVNFLGKYWMVVAEQKMNKGRVFFGGHVRKTVRYKNWEYLIFYMSCEYPYRRCLITLIISADLVSSLALIQHLFGFINKYNTFKF